MNTFDELSQYAVDSVPDIKRLLLGFELFDTKDYLGILCGVYLNLHTGNYKNDYNEAGILKLKQFKDSLSNAIHDRVNKQNILFSNTRDRASFVANHAISKFTGVCARYRRYSHFYSSPNGSGIPAYLKLEPTLNTKNFIYKYEIEVPELIIDADISNTCIGTAEPKIIFDVNNKNKMVYELVMDKNPIANKPELRIYTFEKNRYTNESLTTLIRDFYLSNDYSVLESFLKIPELDSIKLMDSLNYLHTTETSRTTFDKLGAINIYALYKGVQVSDKFKNLALTLEVDFKTIVHFIDNQDKIEIESMELPVL